MSEEKPQTRMYGKRHCPTCEQYGPLEGGAVVDRRTGRWECASCLARPESRRLPKDWDLYVPKQKAPRNSAFDTLSALWNGQRDDSSSPQQPVERRKRARPEGE